MPDKTSATAAKLYEEAGVASVNLQRGFISLIEQLKATFGSGARNPLLAFGHFANVLDIGYPKAIAISTDGVGTKAIVAARQVRHESASTAWR